MLEAILRHPALYTGPRMVKPPVVYIAGLLRGLGPRGRHDVLGLARRRGPASASSTRRTSPGWDDSRWLDTNAFRGRWYIANTALEKVSLGDKKGKKGPKVPNDPDAIVKGALAVLGNPTIRPETHARAARVRARLAARARPAGRRSRIHRSSPTPSASSSPSPPTSRPADGVLRRAFARRASAARPRRGGPRPAVDRARHARCRPAPASTGARFVARGVGLALAVYGGAALRPQAFDEGIAAAAAASAATEGARLGVPRRRCGCALAARPDGRPALPPAPAAARAACRRRHRCSRRTRASPGTPRSRPLAELHGEGKVSVMPGIGYDHPNQSHFTSRHFWEVGAADERLVDRLARPLPRPGRQPRQPAPGPLARLEPAAVARDGEDARRRRRRSRSLRLLGARRLGRGVGSDGRHDRAARRDARRMATRARGGKRRRPAVGAALRAADAVPAEGRPQDARQPGRLPGRRRRLPPPPGRASRRCSPPGCRSASSRSRLPVATTPTTTRRRTSSDGLQADRRLAPRLPARPRGARARRPRARARLDGVRPPGEGERLRRHRPRRGRHRLPDRLAGRAGR